MRGYLTKEEKQFLLNKHKDNDFCQWEFKEIYKNTKKINKQKRKEQKLNKNKNFKEEFIKLKNG
jgi:hypothetical protein